MANTASFQSSDVDYQSLTRSRSGSAIFSRDQNGSTLIRSRSGSTVIPLNQSPNSSPKRRSLRRTSSGSSSRLSADMKESVERLHSNPQRFQSERATLAVGDRVIVDGQTSGLLRYYGPVQFASGPWAGVELDEPVGKHDGKVQGRRYFEAQPGHAIFIKRARLSKEPVVENAPLPDALITLREENRRLKDQIHEKEGLVQRCNQVIEMTKDQLTQQILDAKLKLNDMQAESRDREAAIQKLVSQLSQKDHKIHDLQALNEDIEADKKTLQLKLEETNSKVENQTEELRKLHNLLSRAEDELSERNKQDETISQGLMKENEDLSQQITKLNADKEQLYQKIASLELDLQHASYASGESDAEHSGPLTSTSSANTRILEEEMDKLNEKYQKLMNETATDLQKHEETVQQLKKTQRQLSEHQDLVRDLQVQLESKTLEASRAVNEKHIIETSTETLKAQSESAQREAGLLKTQLESLRNQLSSVESQLKTALNERDELRVKVLDLESEISTPKRRNSRASLIEEDNLEVKLAAAKDKITRLESQVTFYKGQSQSSSQQVHHETLIEEQKLEISRLEQQVNRLREEIKHNQSVYSDEKQQWERAKSQFKARKLEIESQSQDLERQLTLVQKQAQQSRKEVSDLTQQLSTTQTTLSKTKNMNSKLAQQLRALIAEQSS